MNITAPADSDGAAAGAPSTSPLVRAALALRTKLAKRWQPVAERLNGMPTRDRALVLFGGLALIAALEWLAVRPMVAKAALVAQAGAHAEQEAADELARRQAQRQEEANLWQGELKQLQTRLAQLGAGAPGDEKLSTLLQRALSPQAVSLLGLRELGAEAVELHKAEASAGDAAAPEAGGEVAASLPDSSRNLYRHRFELVLGGEPAALAKAIAALDNQLRPLRIERARLASVDGGEVRATLTLVVLGKEKQWLVF